MQPIAEDFKDLENFLVPNITTKERFRELKFHTDRRMILKKWASVGFFEKCYII